MTYFVAIIDHNGEAFGAHFPDAPGCTAMGSTEDEVVANAIEALAEWVGDEVAAGRPVPTPRTYLELAKEGIHGDGQVMMFARIPLFLESGKTTRANISVDVAVLASIDKAASAEGLTRSAFLVAAARDRMKRIAGNEKPAS